MKNINYLNYFFVGVPAIFFLLTFLKITDLIAFGLLFSILTGLFQVTIGGCMLIDEPHNKMLQFYIYGVIFFFFMVCINPYLPQHDFKIYFFYALPVILALHLTLIIYKKANK
ncbi:hypothetical protein ACHRVZ_13540 [Flavobacterium sp. FlaQc-57]|uniref:hypothetical protein n=1 Tax=Flavobacterium sp. FlaQc-57 TaxID=3374186 RepID=UPI003757685A